MTFNQKLSSFFLFLKYNLKDSITFDQVLVRIISSIHVYHFLGPINKILRKIPRNLEQVLRFLKMCSYPNFSEKPLKKFPASCTKICLIFSENFSGFWDFKILRNFSDNFVVRIKPSEQFKLFFIACDKKRSEQICFYIAVYSRAQLA